MLSTEVHTYFRLARIDKCSGGLSYYGVFSRSIAFPYYSIARLLGWMMVGMFHYWFESGIHRSLSCILCRIYMYIWKLDAYI